MRIPACHLLLAAALATSLPGCRRPASPHPSPGTPTPERSALATPARDPDLAATRVELAALKPADDALPLLVAALTADPQSSAAREQLTLLLSTTRWAWPTASLHHRVRIDQISAAPPSLWVSVSGPANTTVRWNLDSLRAENVLFPAPPTPTSSLILSPQATSAIIQRGQVNLLCDASSLKPIRDLGPFPSGVTPASVSAFSPDGLLVATPSSASEQDPSVIWRIRDTATGQTIRASPPEPADSPRPLTAFLDRQNLQVLRADGSLWVMPLSPVEEIRLDPPSSPISLLHAQFASDGHSALVLKDLGPLRPPSLETLLLTGDSPSPSLEPPQLLTRFTWSQHPDLHAGLLRAPTDRLLEVSENTLIARSDAHTPVHTPAALTAAAFSGDLIFLGDDQGNLEILTSLPLPTSTAPTDPATPPVPTPTQLSSLTYFCEALSGTRFDPATRSLTRLSPQDRAASLSACDPTSLSQILPHLDFAPTLALMRKITHRDASPESLLPLWDRIARADSSRASWPAILTLTQELSHHAWHQELTAAVVAAASDSPGESPWNAPLRLRKTFATQDPATISQAIQQTGPQGPAAASALALAMESEHPEWIRTCLDAAIDLPPILTAIAKSRIAWLEGRKADALAPWPDHIPEMADFRLREDWEGWELADFSPAFELVRQSLTSELLAVEIPENSTPEQRLAVIARLQDPITPTIIGKSRFASACLKAALALSSFKEHKEATFQLASRARELGAPPEPCLRAEALALTALGDYKAAHPRWIELITEHPLASHLPGDYAEAAYTAFENADPRQAMEILTTGIHRYPNDANFALRAGWVALLTGNPERAYQFLQTGHKIGFPEPKLENATALLAIAALQSGASDDAIVYYKELVRISPDWKDPATIESLEWPEELKSSLRQLTW